MSFAKKVHFQKLQKIPVFHIIRTALLSLCIHLNTANSLTFDRFVPSEFVDCIVGLTHCSWWQFTSKRTPLMEKSC